MALADVVMGSTMEAEIVQVNLHHGVVVDLGAEYHGLVPISER